MKIYATFDAQGSPNGFYNDDIHTAAQIPSAAVEVSAADYVAYCDEPNKWRRVNGVRSAYSPPPPTSDEVRSAKEIEIRREGSLRLTALAGTYLPAERETWATQQREARAYLLDSSAPTPMLSAIADARGISLTELVSKVMENVAAFEAASGAILGQQQALLDRLAAVDLQAADALDQLAAIAWEV